VCGDGIDQDCDTEDLPCSGTITLGTPLPDLGCGEANIAGGAGPGLLVLALLMGIGRRRRSSPALVALLGCVVLVAGCSGFDATLSVQTWWGGEAADGDVFFEGGRAFDAVGLTSSFEANGEEWLEIALVGSDDAIDCVGYASFRARAAEVAAEMTAALEDPAARSADVEDLVALACQRLDGAARDAFGWDGSFRGLHLLVSAEDGGTGTFLPSAGAPIGPVLAALPEPGRFASRYVEWGGLGANLLPSGDGVESGYTACVGRMTNAFIDWDAGSLGDVPAAAIAAWGLAGRRGEHHAPAVEEVLYEEGGTSAVGVTLGEWGGPEAPGVSLEFTSFVSLGDLPAGVEFARAALGAESTDGLQACPELRGSEAVTWPEPGRVGLGGAR
jgi:hypothetical protein